jgi:hypothetical protein
MKSFEIGELHPNSPHLFADLAELLLLVGYNGRTRLHANDLETLLLEHTINSDEIDEEEELDLAEASSADRNSRHDRQIEDVLTQLSYRDKAFGAWYPFDVAGGMLECHTALTDLQRLYRLLLACSRLRSFGRSGLPQRWAKAFTQVARSALVGLAPSSSISRVFDANSDDRHNYYGTDLRHALRKMGNDLGVLHINEVECDKSDPSGDGGFDLIANLHFDDGAATAYAILGQCGAQETDWPKKTLEAHALNCRSYFQIQFDYPSVMFTPLCYRTATGEWVNNKSANGILLADRQRILHLINAQQSATQIVAHHWFTDFEAEFLQFGNTDLLVA